jgi:hypothetical protein
LISQRQDRSVACTRSRVHRERTAVVAAASAPGAWGADRTGAAVERGAVGTVEEGAAWRRPVHQRPAKYRAASVTAQLATTLCATRVPTIRLIQNRAIRTRNMGSLSSAGAADTEMPPWTFTRAETGNTETDQFEVRLLPSRFVQRPRRARQSSRCNCLRHAWRTVRCAGVDAISTWPGGECCYD